MFKRIAVVLAVLGATLAQADVPATAPVIEAAGRAITRADFEQMLAGDPRMAAVGKQPGALRALGNDIGRAFALEAEARKRELDKLASVQMRVRNYTMQLLASELLITMRKDFLKDQAALDALYAKNQAQYTEPRVRHILIRTRGSQVALRAGQPELSEEQARTKAEALLARLQQGADFAALARAESDDLGSAAKGGDIGFLTRGGSVAAFEHAAYSLPTGTLSAPVRTEFGFHILRVDERRPMTPEALKAVLANELAHQALAKLIEGGYTLNPAYFTEK